MSEFVQDNSPDATGEAAYWSGDVIPSRNPDAAIYAAGAACFAALNRLLRECTWETYQSWPIGFIVGPNDGARGTVAAMLAAAESAHTAWVRAHGE